MSRQGLPTRLIVAAVLVAGCSVPESGAPSVVAPTADESAEAGRLMVGVFLRTNTEEVVEAVEDGLLGGVLITDARGNTPSEAETAAAIGRITAADPSVLVMADQEGGNVNGVVFEGMVLLPPFACLRSADVEQFERFGWATGRQLGALGINLVLGPVADLAGSPASPVFDRSLGSDPAGVSERVDAWIEGLASAGVGALVKHFPGLGATTVDSHQGLPTLEVPIAEWRAREAMVFGSAVEAGAVGMMTAHVRAPDLGVGVGPMTLFSGTRSLVEAELDFDGVLITDDLSGMGALEQYSMRQRIVGAVAGGHDLLLGILDPASAVDALDDAVASGVLSSSDVAAASLRVDALRLQLSEWSDLRSQLTDDERRQIEAVGAEAWESCEAFA